MSKVLCFGEMMIRLSPLPGEENIESTPMQNFVGGAELNVARALAAWKVPVGYCTAAPDNFVTKNIFKTLEQHNIDCSAIQYGGKRLGIYYLLQGGDIKAGGVVFDRENSSFANLLPGTINWELVLEDVTWFHLSAIAASLSANATAVCLEALEAAKAMGIKVSIDLNYRETLWQYGVMPTEVMPGLLKYCDTVMGNIWAVEKLLGITAPVVSSEGLDDEQLIDAGVKSIKELQERYAHLTNIAYTFRLPTTYKALLSHKQQFFISKKYILADVADKVGTGDCFMAGLIYGFEKNLAVQEIIDFAASAAVGKMAEKGDATKQTTDQIKKRYS